MENEADTGAVGHLAGRILVVEDDRSFGDYLCRILQEAGAEVEAVSHGAASVAAAGEQAWNLILMNLDMPFPGGRRAARRLRSAGVRAPIVAVTASDGFSFPAATAADLGFDAVLRKPLDRRSLVGACARWLAVERARVECGPCVAGVGHRGGPSAITRIEP